MSSQWINEEQTNSNDTAPDTTQNCFKMIPIDKVMVHGIIQSTSSGQGSYDFFIFYNQVKNHMIHPKIICNMTMPKQNCFFLHKYCVSSKIQLYVTPLNGAKRINNHVNTTQFTGNSNSSSDKKLNTSCRWYHTFKLLLWSRNIELTYFFFLDLLEDSDWA